MSHSWTTRSHLKALSGVCALVVIAGVAAGCGSSPSSANQAGAGSSSANPPAGAATSADTHRLAAIKYARCMRSHGVNVLDPDQNGNIQVVAPNTPKAIVDRANQACQELRVAAVGPGMTPAERMQALKQFTSFTHCMRAHRIPMADPINGPNGVGYSVPPGISPSSQVYKTAEAACKHLLPNGG